MKIVQTEISSCIDGSRDLLSAARLNLNEAGDAYFNVSRELSRLEDGHEELLDFVDELSQENVDLRSLVDSAMEHAQQLRRQADELDR